MLKNSTRRSLPMLLAIFLVLSATAGTLLARETTRTGGRRAVLHPQALRSVDDCSGLRSYLIEAMVERVIEYRYGSRWFDYGPWSAPGVEGSSPDDYTTTNVQEEGVDELDIVKTDGSYLYTTHDRTLSIIRSWPAADSEQVAKVELAGTAHGLLLLGDYLLVISRSDPVKSVLPDYYGAATNLLLVDVADRTAPHTIRSIDVDGELIGARMINGQVYLVLWDDLPLPEAVYELVWSDEVDLPDIPWDSSPEEREAGYDLARDLLWPLVEESVSWYGLDELLPQLSDGTVESPGPATPLLGCSEVYRPAEGFEHSMLSVLHLDLGAADPVTAELDATGLMSRGWTIYTSLDAMYVAYSNQWRWLWWGPVGDAHGRSTIIHKLALGGEKPVSYVATGKIPGWLLNQFSMDEHDGDLRVASTRFDWWWGMDEGEVDQGSIVSLLRDDRVGNLVEVGRIDGIAPGERIYATRFLGDVGYVVTFRQVDPLFTLDLSDPSDPQIIGELKVPGYSAYLHPIDNDQILAVGKDATDEGRVLGLQVSLFDVSDLANPGLTDKYLFKDEACEWSWSEALSDHHAFTFHHNVLSIPAYRWQETGTFSGLLVFSVDSTDGISLLGTVDHAHLPADRTGGWSQATAQMRRSVYIEDYLYSVSTRGVVVSELLHPEEVVAEVPFLSP